MLLSGTWDPSQPALAFFLAPWFCKNSRHGILVVSGTGLVMHDLIYSPDKLRRWIICHRMVTGYLLGEGIRGSESSGSLEVGFVERQCYSPGPTDRDSRNPDAEPRSSSATPIGRHSSTKDLRVLTSPRHYLCVLSVTGDALSSLWPIVGCDLHPRIPIWAYIFTWPSSLHKNMTSLVSCSLSRGQEPCAHLLLLSLSSLLPCFPSPWFPLSFLLHFLCACVVCMHVCLFACMWVHVCGYTLHVCSYVRGVLRLILGGFFHHTLLYWDRLTDLSSLASSFLWGPLFLLESQAGCQPTHYLYKAWESQVCLVLRLACQALTTEHYSSHLFLFFSFPTL